MSNTTNHVSRVSRVSDVVASAFNAINAKDEDRRDAKTILTAAANDAVTTREGQLVALANFSASEHWELSDIEDGVTAALKNRNSKDTAINTFASEIKRACNPHVRNHVPMLQELAQNMWDQELATEDKKSPRPLRVAFVRRYHMLQRMIGNCIETRQPLETPTEVTEWAISLDPAKDRARALKRYTALKTQLRAILDEFPDLDNEQPKSQVQPPKLRKDGTPMKAPQAPVADVVEEAEPAGVSDLLDEALRDIEAA
jgi:hypothetical protein